MEAVAEDAGTRGVLQEDRRRKSFRAVERDRRPDHAGAEERLPAAFVEIRRHPRLHDRSGQADHRQGSRAAGAGAGKSGAARAVESHDVAVCRRADGGSRRHRAGAPAQPVGAAFRARRQGRLYLGRRRAHRDGAGRFRHHAVDDLARSFQRNLRADVLARRPRYSDGAVLRCLLRGRPPRKTSRRSPDPAGDSFARYGHNLLPVDEKRKSKTSPIFNYPYSYTREALEQAKLRNEWDACHGLKLKFSNPETGDFAMPTIGTFIQLLPKGFKTARYRSTDATVFAAIEGKGRYADRRADLRMGPARPVRGAELAMGHPRGRCGFGAVQFLGPPGAAEARSVPRRSRQCVRVVRAACALRDS